MEGLKRLCIEGTNVMLLELPYAPWSNFEYNAVADLCFNKGFEIVLAHYERFAEFQKGNSIYEDMLKLPVKVQINAESLLPIFGRKRWLDMFDNGAASLLGSDCHDLSSRPANLAKGRERFLKKAIGWLVVQIMWI